MHLPLLDYLCKSKKNIDLSDVALVGAQHILETTRTMLDSLISKGLKPSNVSVLGKCYSTSFEVACEMEESGIYVSPYSTQFNSIQDYDTQYHTFIDKFGDYCFSRLKKNQDRFKKIILLDDGGFLIKKAQVFFEDHLNLVGIEQTSSGFHALKDTHLDFPVINVARSSAKLEYESPMIAQAIAKSIKKALEHKNLRLSKALIIGGGAIGRAIADRLKKTTEVKIFDVNPSLSSISSEEISEYLQHCDLIIGATGIKSSISNELLANTAKPVVVISASSSDREFDAVHLREGFNRSSNCHKDYEVNNILLLNSGFPVNFYGGKHSVPPHLIQLTRSLLALAVFQGVEGEFRSGLIDLDPQWQELLLKEFQNLSKSRVFHRVKAASF